MWIFSLLQFLHFQQEIDRQNTMVPYLHSSSAIFRQPIELISILVCVHKHIIVSDLNNTSNSQT